jgi:glutamate N-acetyltransferase/amino-acid N-acetyltransferase
MITSAKGFLAAGVSCGLKKSGRLDLALLVCPSGANAAAMFTTNKIISAAVQVSKNHIKSKKIFAVVANSGGANACTGEQGLQNAIKMCRQTAKLLKAEPNEVLVASTGIIGEQLPMKKVTAGISKAAEGLSASASAGLDFAKAIMTTDTKVKKAVRRFRISGKNVTIAGTAKGAGMIGPDMATTLCFITTDAAISKAMLTKSLKEAIENSLNRLTVDGWQSTNDTVIILASGAAGNRPIVKQGPAYKKFSRELMLLCQDLARQMALDAEGATKSFKVVVKSAASKADAARAAKAVADYNLVKCAVHGSDANWGRIICAVGSCGVELNERKLTCKIGNVTVFKNGRPSKFDHKKVKKIILQKEHTITIELGAGKASDFYYGCDLSKEYVTINADYHT